MSTFPMYVLLSTTSRCWLIAHSNSILAKNTPRGALSTLIDSIKSLSSDGTIPEIADIVDVCVCTLDTTDISFTD
jgi:hypothetical protein